MSDRASASAERLKQRRLDLQTRSQKNVSDFKDRTSASAKRISASDAKRKESSDADKAKQKEVADAHRERVAKKYSDIRARRQKEAERKQMKDEIKSELSEKDLNAAERRALPTKDFALPGKGEGPEGKQAGSYPIPDEKHARSALSLVSQHGTSEEKAKVRAKVRKKFPNIDVSEADDYSQRDKELKKTNKARNQRFKDLHTATNTDSNVDVNEGRVARAIRDTIDKLPQGRPGGKRDKIRQAAVNAEIRDKKSKEKGTTTYNQWSDAVNAAKKRNKS